MNTLTIVNIIILAAATSLLIIASLRRLRLPTRLRNLTRRVLGIEDYETMVLNELRSYRSDVDRWTRDVRTQTRRNADAIASVRLDTATKVGAIGTRGTSVRTEVEELGILLRRYTEALGPIWTTASGHKMPLRLLGTSHLKNILAGGFTRSISVTSYIESELERRRIDTGFRVDEMNGKPAPTRDTARTEAHGRAITLDVRTMRRLKVLPLWGQHIISELRNRRHNVLTPSNNRRLKGLPIWTRELITDLVRRA